MPDSPQAAVAAGRNGVFFHWSAIVGMDGYRVLEAGDRVEYTVEQTPRGPAATMVRKLAMEHGFTDDDEAIDED